MAIKGIGVDIASIERFERAFMRVPRLAERLFTERERTHAALLSESGTTVRGTFDAPTSARAAAGSDILSMASLAARFAAKEAVVKALGGPGGLRWHDCEILREEGGAPRIEVTGTVAEAADKLGITTWHISLSHDAGMAVALVIAEGDPT